MAPFGFWHDVSLGIRCEIVVTTMIKLRQMKLPVVQTFHPSGECLLLIVGVGLLGSVFGFDVLYTGLRARARR